MQEKHHKTWYNQLPWWGWLILFLACNQGGAYMMRQQDPIMMTIGAAIGCVGIYALIAMIAKFIKRKG
jgi:hypothetical protein